MMDRTTKFLLVAVAVALWGLLLRPAFTPIPAQAQNGGSDSGLVVSGDTVYFHRSGHLFQFNRALVLQNRAEPVSMNHQPTYRHFSADR
jgi:hypothetical protein